MPTVARPTPDAGVPTRTLTLIRAHGRPTFQGADESAPAVADLPPPRRTLVTPNGRVIVLGARGLVYAPCTRFHGLVIAAIDSHGDYGTRYRELPPDVTADEQDRAEAELLAQLERDDPTPAD